MQLVLLSHDLMISARVEGAARQQELTMSVVRDQAAAVAAASADACRLLIVDLRLPDLDVGDFVNAVRACREQHVPIVACGPHVHEAKLAAARDAGCDAVVTRGQLDREAEEILLRVTKPA